MKIDSSQAESLEFHAGAEVLKCQDYYLRSHIEYVSRHSPFYQKMFAEQGIDAKDIRTLKDLPRLPFTTKEDLARSNAEFVSVSDDAIVDLCLTSGTTGDATPVYLSASDLDRVAYNEEISFRAAGLRPQDRVLVAAAIDRCFMAGMAYFLGLNRLGAMAIRAGSSNIPMLKQLVTRQRPTAMVGVPTLFLALAHRLRADGIDPSTLGVQRLVCIGEPVRCVDLSLSPLGQALEKNWGAGVFGTYASTEMATAFGDCTEGQGGHIHPDLIAVEIIDESGNVLPPGHPGEVVATPLQVTGMPLVRFRTGDIATLHAEPCACGRNSSRLGPVLGRKAQMLKYRGTTVYPPAIFNVLQQIEEVRGYYIEVFDEFALSDRIRVIVGSTDPHLDPAGVAETIAGQIRVKPEVIVATPEEVRNKTIQEGKRKPVTFFDHRRLQNG